MSYAVRMLRRLVAYELAMWHSLYRWVFRRPLRLEPGAREFSYIGVVKPILWAFIVLSAVEIPIFDLILRHVLPWEGLRRTVLVLGVYGLLWMIGLMAMLRMHPHVAEKAGLRVRNGATLEFQVPWDAVESVRARYRSLPSSRAVHLEQADSGTVLSIGTGRQTSVDLVLREPLAIDLPAGRTENVSEIRLYADEPDALAELTRRHAGTPDPAGQH
ncbi:hypothetical protein EV385_4704 [Krasilnikovia cinnamomea]|uniref:PH (Pleckstrin Homology) domain-containing protein n=1 Tax=Krasilnikovia cinnamomea TaxID=349313 RepID=A0A4Q7ZP43_9ACTN|nr:hypothetical protein [Krasilnikovia cinnamomea]RZU52820.1 hypothetical protein EV385_4704 [Krasilnikovia cinnamomea]